MVSVHLNLEAKYLANPSRADHLVRAPSTPALAWHRAQAGYARTPLVSLEAVAAELGFERVWAKDETIRFGLPAFKVLGTSWAIHRALRVRASGAPPVEVLVAATDGNHGLAVAAAASERALRSEILVPRGTSDERIAAIEERGANVRVVDGGYDDAVRAAAALSEALGAVGLLVSDTALSVDDDIPQWVVEGYLTLFAEIGEALLERCEPPPDLVLLPVGAGGLASAGCRWFRGVSGIRLVAVEPLSAACAQASMAAGTLVTVGGDFDSTMVGLNAGTVSTTAWPDLLYGLDASLAIPDAGNAAARDALREAGVRSGDTGVAGLAGLRALVALHLADRRVAPWLAGVRRPLVLVTEGELPR